MRRLLFLIAILGLLISGYMFTVYVLGGPILCGSGGCETVRASQYARLLGIPTPAYGLVFYFLLALGALLLSSQPKRAYWLLVLLTGTGLAVSAWLTYLEAFVIHAWCRWCVVSAGLSLVAFVIVWAKLATYTSTQRHDEH